MKCNNCGSDNNFEWATVCNTCQQPLRAETDTNPVEVKSFDADETINLEDPLIKSESMEIKENNHDSSSPGDPMDYIMGSKKDTPAETASDSQESIRPEPIEHELTLYRDDNLKVSVSQDPSELQIESPNNDLKISSAIEPEDLPAEDELENQEPNVVQLNPAQSEKKSGDQDNIQNSKHENSTQKIQVSEDSENKGPSSTEKILKNLETLPQQLDDIKQSRGVIYLSGKDLKLTGGVKVAIGDEVRLNDKAFEVKRQPGRSRWLYIGISAFAAVLILTCLVVFTSTKDVGQLIGTVSSLDGQPLIGQGVKIAELNKTMSTNEAGFFFFNQVPAGIYTIDIQTPRGNKIQDRISVVKDQTTTIALKEAIPLEITRPVQAAPAPKEKPKSTSKSETRASARGTLSLNLSPSTASAFIDDRPLGVGSNSYDLEPGSYTLVVKRSGYKDSSQRIRISSDKTLSLDITLAQDAQVKSGGNFDTAKDLENAGNFREALNYYNLALRGNSGNIEALLGKARCLRAEGDLDNAMSSYMQASRYASSKHNATSELAALTGIIEMRPNTFTAYNSRGELYYKLGEYGKAANDFARVVQIDNRNLSAFYKLGDCFYKTGKYSDAISAFTAARELNFADPKAGVWLTKTYLAMGDKKNAKKAYENFKEVASYSARLEYKRDPEWQKVLAALGEKE